MERFESARCAGLYANKSVHSPKFGPSDGNEVRAPRIEKCRNLIASRKRVFVAQPQQNPAEVAVEQQVRQQNGAGAARAAEAAEQREDSGRQSNRVTQRQSD